MSVERWNGLVDRFDVDGLARQIASVGAGYYILTLGQNSGFYLSPNAAYDRPTGIDTGIEPGRCARLDLVADLAAALDGGGRRL